MPHLHPEGPIVLARLLIAAIAVLGFLSPVTAQRTALVPPPITTPELMTYADVLGLSDQQRLGLLPIHDHYKQRYAQFEAKDVRKLQDAILDIARRMQPARFAIPPRQELEDTLDLYKRVLTGAHAVDRSLFDELAATLTEEQALKLKRARTARELATYQVTLVRAAGNFNPGAGVNLTEELPMRKLSPEEKQQVDQILVEYESALLSKTRTIYSTLTEAFEPLLDLVDELGLREMSVEAMMQLAQNQDMILRMQSAFDEASKPFQAAAHDVSQLNLRTSRRLCGVLTPENAHAFREDYFREAYSPALHANGGMWSTRFYLALALLKDDLSAEQVQQIEVLRDEYRRQADAVTDSAVAMIEESREYRTFMQMSRGGGGREIREAAEDWTRKFESISTTAIAALDGVIGPELAAEIDKRKQARKDESDRQHSAEAAEWAAKAPLPELASPAWQSKLGGVPGLPHPMALADLERLATMLDWDEQARTVLGAMYDEYRATYEALLAAPIIPADSDQKLTVPQEMKAAGDRYAELSALDRKLFDDAEALASMSDEHQMIGVYRDARARRAAASSASGLGHVSRDAQVSIDPLFVAAGVPLDEAGCATLTAIAQEHGPTLTALAVKQLETIREIHRLQLLNQRAHERDDKNKEQINKMVSDQLGKPRNELDQLRKEIAQLNRRVADDLAARLPGDQSWSFRIAYQKAAYPDQYFDYNFTNTAMDEALKCCGGELTTDQQEGIAQLRATFQAEFFTLTERIIELDRLLEGSSREERLNRERVDSDDERRQRRFDRDELGARTRMRLRMLLPAEVVKKIPALGS